MTPWSRAFTRWADRGAIAVALLAAVALAVTVRLARDDVERASEATARGEGEALAARLREQRDPRDGPPSQAFLAAQVARLRDEGLRYIAIRTPRGVVEAGESTIPSDGLRPGAVAIRGDRALLVLPPPHPPGAPGPGGFPPPPFDPRAPPPPGWPPPPPPAGSPWSPPETVVLEFAPSLLPRLREGMSRTVTVGAVAAAVLLAFAGFLTVRAVRRGRDEQRAEHDRRLMALGQMSAVLAHELRNPLASLKGNAQLLEEVLEAGTKARAKATLVVSEAVRLERLMQDLLAFVRDGELVRRPISPSALVARAVAGLPPERIVVDVSSAPEALQVDEARLAAALGNLVRNALEAGGDAAVLVRLRALGQDAVIEVRDHGPGIAEADADRVFEPFFTTRLHGTGLGLAVARRAVEQHGGTLRVESPAGGGALLRVVLPGAGAAA